MSKEVRGVIATLREKTEDSIRNVPVAGRFFREVGEEIKRLGKQGSMELASAIFNQHAWVPYGPGQYAPDEKSNGVAENARDGNQQDQSRGR